MGQNLKSLSLIGLRPACKNEDILSFSLCRSSLCLQTMKLIFCLTILLSLSLDLSFGKALKFRHQQMALEEILKEAENFKRPYCKDKWPTPSHTDPESKMDPVSKKCVYCVICIVYAIK